MSAVMRAWGVRKRDGSVAFWEHSKVAAAVGKALAETGEGAAEQAEFIASSVEMAMQRAARMSGEANFVPSVEAVQDEVERALMLHGLMATAKAYILYREKRAAERGMLMVVPAEARRLAAESRRYFPNGMSEFVYYRTYSRWRDDLGRREAWVETVDRYMGFMRERVGGALTEADYLRIREAIARMLVMPSMRLMWSAGDAARATNVAAFNCSYIAPSCLRDFGEVLYVLACGTGVGFSCESRNVQELPVVQRQRGGAARTCFVEDSKEGWADALVGGLESWYEGHDVRFDFSGVRPEGAKLRTMGGRASGPGPLRDALDFARRLVLSRQGRRLSNLDVHDLVCKVGDCIVSGGVRRAALISLSDLDDVAVRGAKSGPYGTWPKHREIANNSAVYEERPGAVPFMREWLALAESGTGERGIFNRGGLVSQVPRRRLRRWQEMGLARGYVPGAVPDDAVLMAQVGTNPCGEINLLHKQFCNLTEVVCRAGDTRDSLLEKVRIASVLGTYQSTLTHFPYLSQDWKRNCEAERLLGVSLTGQWDCGEIMRSGDLLASLRQEAVETNASYALRLGINASTAVTCGKPSGTVSQLVDAASGGHPRFAPFYVRRVRISATDPMYRMLRDQGVPHSPENGETMKDARTYVFEFPCKAPEGSRCAADVSALDQLEHWLRVKEGFTEHNPSVTVYVGPDEWEEVGHWVWSHWDKVGGLSFLPRDDHHYPQAPYEEITKEEYDRRCVAQINVDYSMIAAYEHDDQTEGSKELACVAGVCEVP